MAQFVSFRGMMFPALEEVSLTYQGDREIPREKISKFITFNGDVMRKGTPFIYKGPDREALYMLKENGVEYLGQDFKNDPEFLAMCRNRGFNSPEEYLKAIGYDEKKEKERFEKIASKVSLHELPSRENESFMLMDCGGKDSSGNKDNDIVGGFGEPKSRPANEMKNKREAIPV